MIAAGDTHGDRQLGVEILHDLGAGLEELELQAAPEARLVDVGQQRLHLGTVRQLLEQRAELAVDLAQLTAVLGEIDGLPLLVDPVFLERRLFALLGFQGRQLVAPVEPPATDDQDEEDRQQGGDPRRERPLPRIVGVEPLEVAQQILDIQGAEVFQRILETHYGLPPAAGGVPLGFSALSTGWRSRVTLRLNSLTRRVLSTEAFTSISSAFWR